MPFLSRTLGHRITNSWMEKDDLQRASLEVLVLTLT